MRILEARGHLMTLVQPVITLKRHGRPMTKLCKEDEGRAKSFLEMVQQEGVCIAVLLATTAGGRPPRSISFPQCQHIYDTHACAVAHPLAASLMNAYAVRDARAPTHRHKREEPGWEGCEAQVQHLLWCASEKQVSHIDAGSAAVLGNRRRHRR